jgi:hypothetical protein
MISFHSRQAVPDHGSPFGTDSNSNEEYPREKTGFDGAEVDGADSASFSGSEELEYPDGGRGWLIVFGVSRGNYSIVTLEELTSTALLLLPLKAVCISFATSVSLSFYSVTYCFGDL